MILFIFFVYLFYTVGKAASNAVARCRAAIQDENSKALALAIKHG